VKFKPGDSVTVIVGLAPAYVDAIVSDTTLRVKVGTPRLQRLGYVTGIRYVNPIQLQPLELPPDMLELHFRKELEL
jgi:hypothetical protein